MSLSTRTARRATRLVVSLALALTAFLAVSCGEKRPISYVSLGDSLAVGVGASEPSSTGYAPLREDTLESETGKEVDLVQLGLSGETSDSFIGAAGEGPSGASQLSRAAEVLSETPDSVVTLSIGANDLLAVRQAPDAQRETALVRYRRNLSDILTKLEEASGGEADVTVLNVYNPVPGDLSDTWVDALNEDIRRVAGRHGATVADVNSAFDGQEVRYTNSPRDFHPNDRGYRAIAGTLRNA